MKKKREIVNLSLPAGLGMFNLSTLATKFFSRSTLLVAKCFQIWLFLLKRILDRCMKNGKSFRSIGERDDFVS